MCFKKESRSMSFVGEATSAPLPPLPSSPPWSLGRTRRSPGADYRLIELILDRGRKFRVVDVRVFVGAQLPKELWEADRVVEDLVHAHGMQAPVDVRGAQGHAHHLAVGDAHVSVGIARAVQHATTWWCGHD